jgi:opacity protein-like surface antigen
MKKVFAVFALLVLSGIPTLAQMRGSDTPLFEVNGGYTYMWWQVPDAFKPPNHYNFNGWNAGATVNFFNWLGLALDTSGVYASQGVSNGGASEHIYSFLAGPRFYPIGHHRFTPYVHGLVGVASYYVNFNAPGVIPNETDNNLSFAVGAGLDWKWTKHITFRPVQVDYQQTRALHSDEALAPPGTIQNQNNVKYSGGIVIRFGEK